MRVSTLDRSSETISDIYMRVHTFKIPASSVRGDRLHEGAIRIPFKQVASRMKLISLRLLRTLYIPEAPVFHCSPISPFGKLREMNEFSAGSE